MCPNVKKLPQLLFGPGGIPKQVEKRDSLAGIARVNQVGLGCMELEFVRRVSMGESKAAEVKVLAEKLRVALSVHAPYYINLNSPDAGILEASKRRLLLAARIGAACGAASVAFHSGSYMGQSSAMALRKIKKNLKDVWERCKGEGIRIQLRPETSGRRSQFGTINEILSLSTEVENVFPCVDFAHLHSYAGKMNTYGELASILEWISARLGEGALKDMHIHVSGIRFSDKGEREHVNLLESDLNYLDLMQVLRDFSVGGRIICESPDREPDALLLQKTYQSLPRK